MPKRRWLKRELVIERAAEMADETGSAADVSLTALAQALNIRTPSLYNHVANLDDLHYGLAVFGVRQLLAELRQAAQGLVGEEAVLAMATTYRQFAHDHPGLYPLTVRAPDPEHIELTALSEEFVQFLLLIMSSMGLQGNDAVHAIRGLRAVLHGFVSLEAAGGYKMLLDKEESFSRLVAAYISGVQPQASEGKFQLATEKMTASSSR
ncbi:MAG: TetR-like C-terminal domain-containing protein [Candidatus Promineifilaceae bacterium]|nr:TetR-like C-terminal domain-containing protein [Candidatus Promineifilaceae bacterium]